MKNTISLLLILTLALFSCRRNTGLPPEAHFHCDIAEPEVGQEVTFTNDSRHATQFEWDFGDGVISEETDPVHVFTGTGSFDVILTAYSDDGESSEAILTINVTIPTLLEIDVLEYYHEYVISGASVWLFPTLDDWDNQTNIEAEGFTDDDGIVVFSHLGPYVYYVDVWEANHDNYTLRQEDVAYIRTDQIIPHKINRFTAWVDVADHGKGNGFHERTVIIKKTERKAGDKSRLSPLSDTTGWQDLYKNSIRLSLSPSGRH